MEDMRRERGESVNGSTAIVCRTCSSWGGVHGRAMWLGRRRIEMHEMDARLSSSGQWQRVS